MNTKGGCVGVLWKSEMVEDLRITHGLASPRGMLMGLKLPLDINTYAYYSISVRGRSYGIEIVRGSVPKRHKNQKFPLGHLGSMAPPSHREESASHHVVKFGEALKAFVFHHCASAQILGFRGAHLAMFDGL